MELRKLGVKYQAMKKLIKSKEIYTWIGYVLLSGYGVVSIVFLIALTRLNMLPGIHLTMVGIVLAIIGVVFSLFHGKKVAPSVTSSALTILLTVFLCIGILYIQRADETLDEVTTIVVQTDVISVIVLYDDPAESLEDARDYEFGIVREVDRENTDLTIQELNNLLGANLLTTEFEDFVAVADALREEKVGAVIVNDALFRVVAGIEGFEWMHGGIRILEMVEHEVVVEVVEGAEEVTPPLEPPEELPNTFTMLITGIDTYGSVAARARSDVNILMVVNTDTKEILLLSTPRDAFVTFDRSGDVGDKLTHAGIYGVEQSISAIERVYGIQIDYFFRLNFTGFMEIIDALGGVEVYSHYHFTVYPIRTYEVGWNQLTGIEALAFARERAGFAAGDHQRAAHQMEVIRALIAQAASPALLLNFNAVMSAVSGSFETNMPRNQMNDIVRMQLADMAGWTITSFTTGGTSSMGSTFSMPGHMLYIIHLHEESILEARRLIHGTKGWLHD